MKQTMNRAALLLLLTLCGACSGSNAGLPPPGASPKKPAPMAFKTPPVAGTTVFCPVARQEFVVPQQDAPRATHQGKHYVFCCDGCKAPFVKNPNKYLGEPRR